MFTLYEFAVLLQPRERNGKVVEEGKILVEPTTIFARDEEQAQLIAGRSIPEEFMSKLDRLTLAVRPF